jgi:hypothetical protein
VISQLDLFVRVHIGTGGIKPRSATRRFDRRAAAAQCTPEGSTGGTTRRAIAGSLGFNGAGRGRPRSREQGILLSCSPTCQRARAHLPCRTHAVGCVPPSPCCSAPQPASRPPAPAWTPRSPQTYTPAGRRQALPSAFGAWYQCRQQQQRVDISWGLGRGCILCRCTSDLQTADTDTSDNCDGRGRAKGPGPRVPRDNAQCEMCSCELLVLVLVEPLELCAMRRCAPKHSQTRSTNNAARNP